MKDLSLSLRTLILCECCKRIDPQNGQRLRKKGVKEIMAVFPGVSERTIRDIWYRYRDSQNEPNFSLDPQRKGHSGRSSQLSDEIIGFLVDIIAEYKGELTYDEIHSIAKSEGIDCCRTTILNWCHKIGIFEESSYVKPALSEHHKIERIRYCLSFIKDNQEEYIDLSNRLHLDEKKFTLTPQRVKRKRVPGDSRPEDDTCQHKSHITDVMFICVIGPPTDIFDGKGAIMPIVEEVEAQRNSKNRPRGTIELKEYSLTADSFLECMTMENGVIDVIAAQFEEDIIIQMDNAPPHTGSRNLESLNEYCLDNGFNITFTTQPAQSPDLNYCDGSFFNSLQKRSFKLREGCKSVQDLVDNVYEAWDDYPMELIRNCTSHIYSVMNAILENDGDNQFKNPHANVRENLASGQAVNKVTVSKEKLASLRQKIIDHDLL